LGNPAQPRFAIAEEVTIKGAKERRPDIVFYINGIAIGVLELKKVSVSANESIRQISAINYTFLTCHFLPPFNWYWRVTTAIGYFMPQPRQKISIFGNGRERFSCHKNAC